MITNSEAFLNIVYGHELKIENGNLVFPNLFQFETGVKIVDPTIGPQSKTFPLETDVEVFTSDLVVPNAANYADSNWVLNGWEPAASLLPKQLAILVGNNKPLEELNQQKNTTIIKATIEGVGYTVALIQSGNYGAQTNPISFYCYPFLSRVVSVSDILTDITGGSESTEVLAIKNVSGGTATTTLFNGKISSVNFTANRPAYSVCWFVVEAQNKTTLAIRDYLVTMYVEEAPPVNATDDIFNMIQWDSLSVTTAQLLANDTTSYPPIVFNGLVPGSAVGGTATLSGSNINFTGTGLTGEPAGFKYSIRDAQNNTSIGNVSVNVLELPPIEAYLFSGNDLTVFLAEYTPPTQATIFNSWARFGNNTNYFPAGTTPTGEAASWTMSGGNFMCTVNSSYFTGFISPKAYSNYTHSATMSSTAADDDSIALIVAFKRIGNVNYCLMVNREPGGNQNLTGNRGFSFLLNVNGTNTVIKFPTTNSGYFSDGNWSNRGRTRVRVQRIGNTIIARATQWIANPTDNDYHVNSVMELDMTQYSNLSWALGEAPYGYACLSQQNSLYSNITFEGGLANEVMDPVNNTVYTYNGTNWVASPTATIQSTLGYPRTVTNPETGRVYRIEANSVTDITP